MAIASIYNKYIFRSLFITTIVTTIVLAVIILLTQSLKFLELIIDAGASGSTFWMLAFLALPRFFEVILPIALMISTIFIYSRMASDSEIVVMRAAGTPPLSMGKPAITLALLVTFCLIIITSWLAPASLANMQKLQQVIKAQYSTLLFRERVFNNMGDDLTVYIENRNSAGELEGLLIHDSRENLPTPVTIIAKRGLIVATEDGHQVLVYDGSRQDFNEKTGALNRLNFERYTIDLPEVGVIGKRWKQPDERTIFELLNPDMSSLEDVRYEDQIRAEIHKRLITPFLAINYTMMVLCCLLLGPINRRGQMKRILLAVSLVIMIQSLYLSLFSRVAESFFSLVLLYLVVFLPILISLFALSFYGEKLRRQLLYLKRQKDEEVEGAPS